MTMCRDFQDFEVCYDDGTSRQTLLGTNVYEDDGLKLTVFKDAAGAIVDTSAGTVTVGACPVAAPDVEWEKLCDDVNGDGTDIVEFFRRSITTFDANGDVVDPVTVDDFELDKVTAYTATNVVACNEDCDLIAAAGVGTDWSALA